jgi:DNA repair exonuclease SbcCD nuclease subunit
MKIVMVSDGHFTSTQPPGRLDNALDTCMRKFNWLLDYCQNNDAVLLQAGDLFDSDRDWYILAEAAEALHDHDVNVYTIPGQHDKYYRTKQKATNLGVLEKAGLVHVLGATPFIIEWYKPYGKKMEWEQKIRLNIYGAGWGADIPKPENDPIVKGHVYNILVIHAPIAPDGIYPGHEITKPIFMAKLWFNVVLCGDIHHKFHINKSSCDIINTGPIFRHRAEEYNLTHKPGFYLWQDGALEWHEIPHEAADVVISRDHLTTHAENRASMQNFTAKLRDRPTGKKATLRERVLAKLKQGRYHMDTIQLLKEVMGNAK